MLNGTYELHRIRDGLWAVDEIGRTTMYIVEGSRKVLLLDTGLGLTDLKGLIAKNCGEKEIITVNTHAHGDHTSGNDRFDRVYVGRGDLEAAAAGLSEAEIASFREHFLDQSPYVSPEQSAAWHPRPARETLPLKDGDVLELGGVRLEVLETPGHTKGSICLFDRERGDLFTGDLVLTWGVWGHLPESASLENYGRSVHRLALLGNRVKEVFPAHGKADNPCRWPMWHLDPDILRVYDRGIRNILDRKLTGSPYSCFLGSGRTRSFEIGGITWREDRLTE